ncbi:dethiobiotin synthase [Halothiobacillus diazotrophicus]|uniref:ATP-dependent dethiobiotin synthetase BioD n=1 Tax=Halothiobacillus diazotrophicus TaxID=1860122 RepID=A0A191ZGW2_9GAMM|nr:dethiobiotin synthase [Halothiobacillus diazotrophicus]ANJ67100.1 dethiobiotin synthase [Halothiobacillus diazotrophicus]
MADTHATGWVMLGTDTGVGKTFIGCQIIEALRAAGHRVRARKPIETGCANQEGTYIPADATALWNAAGRSESLETVCPLRFLAPLAAPEAARHEGRRLEFAHDIAPLLPAPNDTRQPNDALWLIESAGGLMSPLTEDALGLALASHTRLPVILVAPDRLGTLSGLFASMEALDRRGIPIAAVILNRRPEDRSTQNDSSPDNLMHIRHWLPQIVTRMPHPAVLSHDQRFSTPVVPVLLGPVHTKSKPTT